MDTSMKKAYLSLNVKINNYRVGIKTATKRAVMSW